MMNWNTHSKSLPQEIVDVFFFNKSGSSVTPVKGQLLQYTPAAVLSTTDGVSTAIKCSVFPDVWGDATDVLPLTAKIHLVGVAAASYLCVAGILAEDPGAIANDTGKWVKVVQPGGYAQCLVKETTTVGAMLSYSITDTAFMLDNDTAHYGAGVVQALEIVTISSTPALCWCKLLTGDVGVTVVSDNS